MQHTLALYQRQAATRAALNMQIKPPALAAFVALQDAMAAPCSRLWSSYAEDLHPAIQQLMPALAAAPWLVDCLCHQSELFSAHLENNLSWLEFDDMAGEFASMLKDTDSEAEYMRQLRELRCLFMFKIACADLLGLHDLHTTLAHLSDLAQLFCQNSADYAYRQLCQLHGTPEDGEGAKVEPVILGMGKLGGRELNFSSDIDLIVLFRAKGQTTGKKVIDNQSFFCKLAQLLIKYLDTHSAQGFVYRVDMRLRPFGEAGALALSFTAAEQYYQSQGRAWERYALIKAAVLVGNENDAKMLHSSLNAFVYRRYLDFSALQALRELKRKIAAQVERKNMHDNIKLGAGGIREIEFIAQSFQLIYGGKDLNLQQRGLAEVFAALGNSQHLDRELIGKLLQSYNFLRMLENRLQMSFDQQCHTLPADDVSQLRMAYAMGLEHWQELLQELNAHRELVAQTFAELFAETKVRDHSHWQLLWSEASRDDDADLYQDSRMELGMGALEFMQLRKNLAQIQAASLYKLATIEAKDRVDAVMPLLLAAFAKEFAKQHLTDADKMAALLRALQFLRQVVRRSNYLVLLQENPNALARLVLFLVKSSWVSELLSAQPVLLDSVLDARELLSLKDKQSLRAELDALLDSAGADSEAKFDALRQFKNNHILRVAAIDISGGMPLMRVSDQLTDCAELLIEKVLEFALADSIARHGAPICADTNGAMYQPSMAVIGYGKLGGIELGYASDLDVVFVHNGSAVKAYTKGRADGTGVIDNSLFFARVAQRFSTMMQTTTRLGQLYEIDTRLRPDGNSGEWVKSLTGFASYQLSKAWTWEHQALVRARFIAGAAPIAQEFGAIRQQVLCQKRDIVQLQNAVLEMREKMRSTLGTGNLNPTSGEFNLKQDRGGILDIEFSVQYLLLAHAHQHPELIEFTDVIRALELIGKAGILSDADSQILIESYRTIRAKIHSLALNKRRAQVAAVDADLLPVIAQVAQIWGAIFLKKHNGAQYEHDV